MWAVEARNFGENKDYLYVSGLTQKEAMAQHAKLSNSREWAMVRSWDLVKEWERQSNVGS